MRLMQHLCRVVRGLSLGRPGILVASRGRRLRIEAFWTASAKTTVIGRGRVHHRQAVYVLGVARDRRNSQRSILARNSVGTTKKLRLCCDRAKLNSVGFVPNYSELSELKEFLDENLDHRHLNEVLGHDRTTSQMDLRTGAPWIVAVRVGETSKTWAEYRP